ncbi:MAG TPA: NADH-quinone oxidoreductase subunit NuoE [Methylomusa anaerophila]|uniref:NADP-reducing hydrogenase subunit HndA n=1 Tax=Methylomusa anaerophila TaxID=1930071 RepID=A0A348AFD1_9FIRM|nr:NADH-quinone oxidoreductase subunit NuoE [Methylomusa anaerophila]BBB89779.1 NADP-reducing hydrogenase subunit HndA [Methylomusa anaerophila]HML89175.1 NADH-quinone oxidoreductase subunit NuoE [Methylomusa anaerophila]
MATCNCGSQVESEKEVKLQELLDHYRDYQGALIPVLQETQNIYGYLPADVLEKISQELRIPFSKVYGVCTFYAQFHLKPRGRNIIRMCLGTACHVRGGGKIFKALGDYLGVGDGGTTEDLRFTLEQVACIGACGLAPCVMVNSDTHGRITVGDIPKILAQYE